MEIYEPPQPMKIIRDLAISKKKKKKIKKE
jgi:hypothetical protein